MTDSSRRNFFKFGICAACAGFVGGFVERIAAGNLPNPSKEAYYYHVEGDAALCDLCPNECIIRPGKTGDCRVRTNRDGKLYTNAYGNPCAIHVDPVEKKPLYHFQPGTRAFSIATAGCNFSCKNCQNWTISQSSPEETRNYDLPPASVVEAAEKYDCGSIAYTYSEPTVFYEYMVDTAARARKKDIKNLMITCGSIKEKPLRNLCKYIDAANVDIKSFDDEIYKKLNGGRLQPVLDAVKVMIEERVWVEITNLVVPTRTDDFEMIRKMCAWLAENGLSRNPLHFSRFTPTYKLARLYPTPIETLKKAREIAIEEGLKHVYVGNAPSLEADDTICPACSKAVIRRKGYRILENNLVNGKCKFCGEKINGVWND